MSPSIRRRFWLVKSITVVIEIIIIVVVLVIFSFWLAFRVMYRQWRFLPPWRRNSPACRSESSCCRTWIRNFETELEIVYVELPQSILQNSVTHSNCRLFQLSCGAAFPPRISFYTPQPFAAYLPSVSRLIALARLQFWPAVFPLVLFFLIIFRNSSILIQPFSFFIAFWREVEPPLALFLADAAALARFPAILCYVFFLDFKLI